MRHRCGKGPSPSLPSRPEFVALLEPFAAIRLPQTADEIRELHGVKRGDSGAAATSASFARRKKFCPRHLLPMIQATWTLGSSPRRSLRMMWYSARHVCVAS